MKKTGMYRTLATVLVNLLTIRAASHIIGEQYKQAFPWLDCLLGTSYRILRGKLRKAGTRLDHTPDFPFWITKGVKTTDTLWRPLKTAHSGRASSTVVECDYQLGNRNANLDN